MAGKRPSGKQLAGNRPPGKRPAGKRPSTVPVPNSPYYIFASYTLVTEDLAQPNTVSVVYEYLWVKYIL